MSGKSIKLADVADLKGGFAFKSADYTEEGHFVLRTVNIRTDGRITKEGAVFIPENLVPQYERFQLQDQDTLFVMVGATLGKVGYVTDADLPALLNQNMWVIRSKDSKKADPRFLNYWFQQVVGETLAWASGSARGFVRRDDYRNLDFPNTPLPIQKRIAHILGTLDDKIKLNRRMNETLEGMARALFKSWFIDFDPVIDNAIRAGNPIPEEFEERAARRRALLDQNQAMEPLPPTPLPGGEGSKGKETFPNFGKLFPDSFRDSELGPIPAGWIAKPLPEVIDVNPQRTLKRGSVVPYLDMKNLPTQGHSALEILDREFSSGSKFQNGDTLLARITPCLENGKTGFVDFLEDGQVGWGSTEFIVLSPKPPLPAQYSYLLARSDEFRTHAIQNMVGSSGRQRVPSESFNTFLLAVPPKEIANRFDKYTAPVMVKIKANADQSRTLATLRDTLLPKLLSGELNVAEIEKEIYT